MDSALVFTPSEVTDTKVNRVLGPRQSTLTDGEDVEDSMLGAELRLSLGTGDIPQCV